MAGQQITVMAVRAKAYEVVFEDKLESDVTITNVPSGARLSVSDPVAGTLARCITLTNGNLKSAAC